MAYDVSALSAYTDEQSETYLYQTVVEGPTLSMIPNLMTGVKSAEKIKIVNTNGVWQTGGSCGFTASGDTSFSERTLTVGKIKVNLEWCEKTLESKYTQIKLKKGSTYEELTFEKEFVAMLQNDDKSRMEQAIWNGDTTAGSVYLNKFDGYRKIIKAASGVLTTADHNTTTWSEANARNVIKGFATKLSASLPQLVGAEDLRLFIGEAEYMTLIQKYMTDDLYNAANVGPVYVEGTKIKIEPVPGLSGKKEMFLMRLSNLHAGTDLENEEEKYEFWYSKDDDVIRYKKEWKFGVQVAFPDEIIYATLL